MLMSALIGLKRIEGTLVLSIWPCGPATMSTLLQVLPFNFAGIQKPSGEISREGLSRKQFLALVENPGPAQMADAWLMLHNVEKPRRAPKDGPPQPVLPLETPGEKKVAPARAAGMTGGIAIHFRGAKLAADFFLPMKRGLVQKMLAAMIARGQTIAADNPGKIDSLFRRVLKLRPNEALAVHWHEDRLFARVCRRDELDAGNCAALIAAAPGDPAAWTVHRVAAAAPKK